MDSASTLTDDEYDLISNPGDLSFDSSVADLQTRNLTVWEPQPCLVASKKFEAVRWSSIEIQDRINKIIGERCAGSENKVLRVYVDGSFDPISVSHFLQLRQAKLSFPKVYLLVGIFCDQDLREHNCEPQLPEAERYELVRHCRWVDEIIPEAPWQLNDDFLRQHSIDFVAIEEGASVNPAYDKIRVVGYDEVKRLGKAIPTRRITGVHGLRRSSPATSPPTPSTSRPPSSPNNCNDHFHVGSAL